MGVEADAGVVRIVVATSNRGKLAELERILDGLPVALVPMSAFDLDSPVEDGDTFEANALIKARAASNATGLPALADDSGLEVDALDGAPGVHSARYAALADDAADVGGDRDSDDLANNRRLVRELADVPEADRTARFVCVAALVTPDGREWTERGSMEGHIIDEPRGAGGFGYDPHFVSVGETRTNAELSPAEKDSRSHRGAAFRAIRAHVEVVASGD
jgi:XTP/dITP diphosphohydrolase